jgi:hypothetical protein
MDGAPGDGWLVVENRQRQVRLQPQVLRLRGLRSAVSHFAQEDKLEVGEREDNGKGEDVEAG